MKVLVTGGRGYLGTYVRQHFDADDLSRRSGRDVQARIGNRHSVALFPRPVVAADADLLENLFVEQLIDILARRFVHDRA